jgi:hypothetical protein
METNSEYTDEFVPTKDMVQDQEERCKVQEICLKDTKDIDLTVKSFSSQIKKDD